MIKIVGLGPGSKEDLTMRSINIMKNAHNLYLRTEIHPNVEYIRSLGVKFKTFDHYYENCETFDEVYESIARDVINTEDVVYAVPGHPIVAEKSVRLITKYAKEKGIEVEIIPALSFIDAITVALKIDPILGLKIIDGLQLDKQKPDIEVGNIITQFYSRLVASDIKLKLMKTYRDEDYVYVIRAAGVEGLEKIEKVHLYEIDRISWIDHLTSLYIPPVKDEGRYDFNELINVMDTLRGEDGCPWDKEQTHESLKRYLIEESYEVIDAIDKKDSDLLCEELGDVLFQIIFHSKIASEEGSFDIRDVIQNITFKMIDRHPHVFGGAKCETSDEVLVNWEKNKAKEKDIKSHTERLKSVPKCLPALLRSLKVQEKASDAHFDWDNVDGAVSKLIEELNEFLDVYKTEEYGKILDEMGDLLFSAVNVCRFLNINPEFALTKAIEKFINRFSYVEENAAVHGKTLEDMTAKEMDDLWNMAKTQQFTKF